MRRIFFAVLALVLVTGFATSQSFAQAAPQSQQGGRGNAPPPPPQSIDLATARKMVAAAEAAATEMNQHVAICVMDARGDVVLFERMDTLDLVPGTTSQGKARAVLLFGIPTGQIADAMRSGQPVSATVRRPVPGAGE